jgi:hypothetical protein
MLRQAQHDKAQRARARAIAISMKQTNGNIGFLKKLKPAFPSAALLLHTLPIRL